jgi:GT2 family glycosyltransferase
VQVTVVVVSYRTGPALWPALASALAAREVSRVVLVDNGNDAAVIDRLRAMAAAEPRLELVSGHGNVGFARGCNLGAVRGTEPVILFMNPDCELEPTALPALLSALETDREAWASAPLLVDAQGRVQPGTPRNLLTPYTMVAEALRLDLLLPSIFPRLNLHREALPRWPFPIAACSGACFAIRRGRFMALGGFDEGYFLHVEDLDFCWRIVEAGGRILCVPAARVLHHGATSDASPLEVERHKAQSFARYLRRYFARRPSRIAFGLMVGLVWLRYGLRAALLKLQRRRPTA